MKPGDVVVIEGISSPRMKVCEVDHIGRVAVCWFDTNSNLQFATFPQEMLIVVPQ